VLLAVLYASSTTPTPSPTPEFDETLVTPGPLGFLAIAVVAIGAVLLAVDMVRRVRRVRYREEVRQEIALEQAELSLGGGDATSREPSAPTQPSDTPSE
jgi:hypothetical protein